MKLIYYKNKTIIEKSDKQSFVFDGKVNLSENIKLKNCKAFESVESAKDFIDFGDTDENDLPNIVYQIIINPGSEDEEIQELTDENLAQELFDGLKIDPAPNYRMIKLVKYDYAQDYEEILDFEDYAGETAVPDRPINESSESESGISTEYEILTQLASIANSAKKYYESFNKSHSVDDVDAAISNIGKMIDNLKALYGKLV